MSKTTTQAYARTAPAAIEPFKNHIDGTGLNRHPLAIRNDGTRS
jgi:hypothetical protein